MTEQKDLCKTCKWAIGLAEGEECHPPIDSDCPANNLSEEVKRLVERH